MKISNYLGGLSAEYGVEMEIGFRIDLVETTHIWLLGWFVGLLVCWFVIKWLLCLLVAGRKWYSSQNTLVVLLFAGFF